MEPVDPNEFFRQAVVKICGSLAIDQALFSTFEFIRRYIPVSGVFLMRPDMKRRRMLVLAAADDSGARLTEAHFSLTAEALLLLEGDALPGLMIINNPENHPIARHARNLGSDDSSVILIRLTVDGKLVGSVAFRAEGRGRYSREQADLLEPLREPFTVALSNYLRYQEVLELKEQLADDNRFLRSRIQPVQGPQIVGAEYGLKGVMEAVMQVAALNSPVLLLGETGTGKELIASQLHHLSSRRDGPFIKVNCGAIPETLMDAELFGHERGAFTGAVASKKGLFERADKGTIFLDEIGEMPLGVQVRLLRVLQEKTLVRVGGDRTIKLDIRVIAATHRNLEKSVAEGAFRDDLYYRLNVFPIHLPALRERLEDIPLLVNHFVQQKSRELGLASRPLPDPSDLKWLNEYEWPGNVRELENVVERALIRCQGKTRLVLEDISLAGRKPDRPEQISHSNKKLLDQVMIEHIKEALSASGGKVAGAGGAAELLGLNPSTLRARMRKLNIPFGRKAAEKDK